MEEWAPLPLQLWGQKGAETLPPRPSGCQRRAERDPLWVLASRYLLAAQCTRHYRGGQPGGCGEVTQTSASSRSHTAPHHGRFGTRCMPTQRGGRGGRRRGRPDGEAPEAGRHQPRARQPRGDAVPLPASPGAKRPSGCSPASLHPCQRDARGAAVWRKVPACPGEGSYK